MECPCCCETYDKRSHIRIECGFCNYEACRDCIQNYILSKPNIPSCMKCDHEWTIQFLMNVCTKTFINKEYKKHREQFLFEREQSRLPEAQQLIHLEKQKDDFIDEANNLEKLLRDKRMEIIALENRIRTRDTTGTGGVGNNFVKKCPMDECRGFLNKQWKCGLCDTHICSKCHEPRGDKHECNPDNLASAQLIKKDSKPCPKCGIYIQKLEGCNQMWCTDCHTAFDWKSGTIVTGTIHNPHFFEARRAAGMQGRNVNDVPCGGLPNHQEFREIGIEDLVFPRPLIPFVCYVEGLIENRPEPDTMDLRIKYLKNEIDECTFKKMIHKYDKSYQKQRELDDIYRMVSTTLSDILRQIVVRGPYSSTEGALEQIIHILNYSNDAIRMVCKKYNSKANNLLYFKFYARKLNPGSSRLRLTFNNKRMSDLENFRTPDKFKFTREVLIAPYCKYGYVLANY